MKRFKYIFAAILTLAFISTLVWAGTAHVFKYGMRLYDEGAAHSTPPSGYVEFYINSDVPYWINDSGVSTAFSSALTAWDDIADPDAAGTIAMTTYQQILTSTKTDGDMFLIQGLGAFGDVSVLRVEQKTGLATDGTVLEVISADTDVDALVVTANSTNVITVGGGGVLTLNGGAGVINFTEFDVSGTTGAITIDDGGNAGNISIEGTVLDINSLDFVGAGAITAAASSAITINPDSGDAAGEDLIITAHNLQLTATGAITMSPDAAVTTALTITDTDYTNALSVGDNAILGTTGIINYTNFDVDAAGGVVCTSLDAGSGDITTTGTISATTIEQDSLTSAAGASLTLIAGAGAGGINIGTSNGTGAIALGDTAAATEVILGTGVNLDLTQGDLTVVDTANSDLVTLTNNTITGHDLIQITATGIRTAGAMINMVDTNTTTANGITYVNDALTSGKVISITSSGVGLTGDGLYMAISDDGTFTGNYINLYDGSAIDFKVARYGATTIGGLASTDMLTITTGDVQIDDGKLEIDTNEDDTTKVERAQATVTGPVFSVVEQTHTAASGYPALFIDQNTTTGTTGALEIDTEGAVAIKIDALVAAGDGMLIDVAGSYTGQGIVADLGTWLGTAGEGFISLTSDSGAVAEVGTGIKMNFQGTTAPGSAVDGKGLWITEEADAKAGQSLIFLDSKNNDAIHIFNEAAGANAIKIDVANSFTGQGIIADLGPWLGTAGEGFISITSDSGVVAEAGQAIKINLQGTSADAAAISGKGLYIKDAAAATVGSFLLHVESDVNGAAYLDGDIDVNFTNNDDNFNIVSNATDYAAGDGVITVYDDSTGQTNTMYLLRLATEADGDANNAFILCEDNSTGAAGNGDTMFEVTYDGSITTEGSLTVSGAQIIGDGATEMVGVRHDVVDGGAGPTAVTAAMSGTVFYNSEATEFDLPADPTGLEFTFVVANASNLHIDPNGTDQILHSTCAAGDRILSATVGDTITLVGLDAGAWYVKAIYPAATDWTDAD